MEAYNRAYFEKRKLIPNSRLKEIAKNEERRLVALMLKSKEVIADLLAKPGITWKSFFWADIASAYNFIANYYVDHNESLLSRDSFRAKVEEKFPEEEVGRMVNALSSYSSIRVTPEDYSQIRQGILARQAQQEFYTSCRGGDVFADILSKTDDQRDAIQQHIDKMEGLASKLSDKEDEFSKTVDLATSMENVLKTMKIRQKTDVAARGVICGIDTIDNEFNGFRRGKYGVFLGLPNGGKTTMMLNFAANMAMRNYKVGYVTIESDADEISERLLSRFSEVESKAMKKGGTTIDGLNDETLNKLLKAGDEIKNGWGKNLTFISVLQKTPITEIFAKLEMRRKCIDFDVVFFDYLDVIGHMVKRPDRADLELADTSQRIQSWGKERNILVWSAQSITNAKIKELRKKDFMENAEKSYITIGVEDVGGSQAISRDSDYVLAIVRHPTEKKLIIYITKSRYDAPADFRFVLEWQPEFGNVGDKPKDFVMTGEDVQKIHAAGGTAVIDRIESGGIVPPFGGSGYAPPETLKEVIKDPVKKEEPAESTEAQQEHGQLS